MMVDNAGRGLRFVGMAPNETVCLYTEIRQSGSSRPWPASLLSFSTSTWGTTRTVTHGINETEVSDEKKVEKKVLK